MRSDPPWYVGRAGCAVAGPRGAGARLALRLPTAIREFLLIATLFILYRAARLVTAGDTQQAFANADAVQRFERAIRLPDEAALQEWLLPFPNIVSLANHYYVTVHFPVTAAFLLWGFFRRPREQYLWARRLIVTLTLLALAVQLLIPLAPPRMLPQFVDTMGTIGPSAYDGPAASLANQYAAMPSLHIGWAALIAIVVWATTRAPIRWLAVAHAVVTVLVVVATANHWWLDGFASVVLLGVALLLHRPPDRRAPVADATSQAASSARLTRVSEAQRAAEPLPAARR